MTPKEHADDYLAKLQDRRGCIPEDIDDDIIEEIVTECREAFAAAVKDEKARGDRWREYALEMHRMLSGWLLTSAEERGVALARLDELEKREGAKTELTAGR